MTNKLLILCALFLMLLLGCQGNILDDSVKPQLCVEGWIEPGSPPVVILTECSIPNKDYWPIDEAFSHFAHGAQVTVMVDGMIYTLNEVVDSAYVPPYVFTTASLCGVEGATYTLNITYPGEQVQATTVIPAVVEPDSIACSAVNDADCYYTAYFSDAISTHDYYAFFARTISQNDQLFHASFMNIIDYRTHNGSSISLPIYRGYSMPGNSFNPFFATDEDVWIKSCHIDSCAYI